MDDQDAFVLSPISSEKSLSVEDKIRAYELLKQIDETLREKLGLELRIINLGRYVYDECKRLIRSEGISSVMSTVHLQEELMPKATDLLDNHLIVCILRDKLIQLSPSNELIIVDNYLFPKDFKNTSKRRDYLQLFKDILAPIITRIKKINFVTQPDYNRDLLTELSYSLSKLNARLSVTCETTNDFHDRIWIVDRSKGLFVGTSLNGIGKRYALVDVIRDEDTKQIVNILEQLHLV